MRLQYVWRLTGAALVASAGACGEDLIIPPLPASEIEEFQVTLTGANEVPAVTTGATGAALLALLRDSLLTYRLDVTAIDSPTVAHIHQGAVGVEGPILVTLAVADTFLQKAVSYSGSFGQNQLRPGQLFTQLPVGFGADTATRYDSLVALMRARAVYVHVHTRQNPDGEIRGQIQPR